MFQPNSPQAVAIYGLDTYIFSPVAPPTFKLSNLIPGSTLIIAPDYAAAFDQIHTTATGADYDSLTEEYQNRVNEVLVNIKSAIEQGTNNATASVPLLYSLGGTAKVFRNIFIHTRSDHPEDISDNSNNQTQIIAPGNFQGFAGGNAGGAGASGSF